MIHEPALEFFAADMFTGRIRPVLGQVGLVVRASLRPLSPAFGFPIHSTNVVGSKP